jgi:hypothetical protein
MASLTSTGIKDAPGHVIQTVHASKFDEDPANITSQTFSRFVDGGGTAEWKVSITNVTSGNDVLVQAFFTGYVTANATSNGGAWAIFRETTVIYKHQNRHSDWMSQQEYNYRPTTISYLDTDPGTGTFNYYVGAAEYTNATMSINSNSTGSPFQMWAMEISR